MPVLRVALRVGVLHEAVVVQHRDPLLVHLHLLAHIAAPASNELLDGDRGRVVVLEYQVLNELLV